MASVVNGVSSDSFMTQLVMSVRSMTTSDSIAAGIIVFGGMLLTFAIWFFLKNTYRVTVRRIYLEGRLYSDISKQRFLFLFRIKKLSKSAVTMLLFSIYQTLWDMTIIGGMIKHYSYLMVPFIVAENPDISPNAAIKLSRQMMKGHKWEYFLNDLTFIGWEFLGSLTIGLLDLFFLNMYKLLILQSVITICVAKPNRNSFQMQICWQILICLNMHRMKCLQKNMQ